MAEYIEREALIAEYDRVHKGPAGGARKLMVDAPSADVVEVRHGEWIKDDDDVCWWLECSVCCEIPPKNRYGYYLQSAYCPNCGAKMDGKGE